jgi:hypothetical protein
MEDHLLKKMDMVRLSLLHETVLAPLSKSSWTYLYGLFMGSLFCSSDVHAYPYTYQTILLWLYHKT